MLYNDDCLSILPILKTDETDMVLVDLPYGQTACYWDKKIDLDEMWKHLKRICKPKAVFVFFTTTKFGNELINSNPKWFKYDIVWQKNKLVGHLSCKKMPMRQHEMVYVFGKGGGIYNPQMTEGKPFHRRNPKIHHNKAYGTPSIVKEFYDGKKYPTSILKIDNNNFGTKNYHTTAKPVELCEWLIKTYSNEGDKILDFCMGSGSTIIACINTNRQYIGVELDPDIFKTAADRIAEHQQKLTMD